jgi:hypothetical protein
VKNIPEPVRAYRVLLDPATVGSVVDDEVPAASTRRLWPALATVFALLVIGAGALVWLQPCKATKEVVSAAALDTRRIAV